MLPQLRCPCSTSACMRDFARNCTRALVPCALEGGPHADKLPGPGKPCAPVLHRILHPAPCRIPPWSVAVVVMFWISQICPATSPCQSPRPVPPSSSGGAKRGRPGVVEPVIPCHPVTKEPCHPVAKEPCRPVVTAGIAVPDPRFLAARDFRDNRLLLLGHPAEETHHHDLLVLSFGFWGTPWRKRTGCTCTHAHVHAHTHARAPENTHVRAHAKAFTCARRPVHRHLAQTHKHMCMCRRLSQGTPVPAFMHSSKRSGVCMQNCARRAGTHTRMHASKRTRARTH